VPTFAQKANPKITHLNVPGPATHNIERMHFSKSGS